jgi:formylglycine-generating enzyme required for sulfatase activity
MYISVMRGILDCDDGAAYTTAVGSYRPNALGLYDTIGNVWEWGADCITDQNQWPEGAYYPPCIAHGGGWTSGPADLSAGALRKELSADQQQNIGFRVVRLISD